MRHVTWILSAVFLAAAAGCSGGGDATDNGNDIAAPDVQDVVDSDMGTMDTTDDDVRADADDDAVEPADVATEDGADSADDAGFEVYVRPEKGEPVTADEIDRITDVYIDILTKTRYFDVLAERIHGWPRDDAGERYWYGTWWSGITMTKADGVVTYRHSADGADNNGMRTAPMLIGACYAAALDGRARDFGLVRSIVRGFNSWAMAFRSPTHPDWETTQVLSRAAYPEPVSTQYEGRNIYIDYSLDRPGEDNGACEYVEVSDNPYWGDIFVKNKRSKDDIGHMMMAISILDACPPITDESDPEMEGLADDVADLMEIYTNWANQVDGDDWTIATVDKDGSIYYPGEDLAVLMVDSGLECEAGVTLRLYHGGNPDDLACGNGIMDGIDEATVLKNDFHQIQRSFHESAVAMAWKAGRPDVANRMLDGLAWRVDVNLDALESENPPANPNLSDLGELVLMSGNAGLPLNWRDVRFLHQRIEAAHEALVGTQDQATLNARFNVFSDDVPDGTYSFDPGDTGLAWRYIGAVLGACASPYWNADSKQVLNCDKIREATF